MILLTLLQTTVAGPVLPREVPRVTAKTCRQQAAERTDDILVCAPGQEQFRLKKLPDRYVADAPLLPRAETSILGGKAKIAADAEQGDVGGIPTNRAMIRLKVPF